MELLMGLFGTGCNVNLNKPLEEKHPLRQIEKLSLFYGEKIHNLRIKDDNRIHQRNMV